MLEFLKIQYLLGRITEERLLALTGKYITDSEYNEITGAESSLE